MVTGAAEMGYITMRQGHQILDSVPGGNFSLNQHVSPVHQSVANIHAAAIGNRQNFLIGHEDP